MSPVSSFFHLFSMLLQHRHKWTLILFMLSWCSGCSSHTGMDHKMESQQQSRQLSEWTVCSFTPIFCPLWGLPSSVSLIPALFPYLSLRNGDTLKSDALKSHWWHICIVFTIFQTLYLMCTNSSKPLVKGKKTILCLVCLWWKINNLIRSRLKMRLQGI